MEILNWYLTKLGEIVMSRVTYSVRDVQHCFDTHSIKYNPM